MENIKFDVEEAIKTSIWGNGGGKHNLGHQAPIFQLCKKSEVPYMAQVERIHPLVEITIKTAQPHKELPVQGEPYTTVEHNQFEENESEDETKNEEENDCNMI